MFFPPAGGKRTKAATAEVSSVSPPCSSASPLFYLKDSLSGRMFLVDTGAAASVFPHRSRSAPSAVRLTAANGDNIAAWGSRSLPLKFGDKRFNWPFLLAAVDRPILGADFLRHHGLLVDVQAQQLLNTSTMEVIYGSSASSSKLSSLYTALLSTPDPYRSLLGEYPELVGTGFADLNPKHGVEHFVETTGPPVFAKPRRLDSEKLAIAKAEFAKMEKAGIIRRSTSAWASPLHMVPKPDGSWRPCGDYRRLNTVTTPDRYPVPHIQDFTQRLSGKAVFSQIDLVKGYYQVNMHPADIPKTAIITPFGLWEFVVMPFGMRNAGNTFQRLMDRVGAGMDFIFIYLDDILVASPDVGSHLDHLRQVFDRLKEFGLVINPAKCSFGRSSVNFLGHSVSSAGVTPLTKHLEAINSFPPPADRQQLQRFLGMVNFYRRFVRNAAKILAPLTDGLKGPASSFLWTPAMEQAFSAAKECLVRVITLSHPNPRAPLSVVTHASASHVGAALQQWVKGAWQPLAFFSKKLSDTETRYSTFDRELLGAYLAVRHFRFTLEGNQFAVLTDHKPLCSALRRVTPPWSARQQRHLSYLAEFTDDIRYLPGDLNPVADCLSRPPPSPPSISAAALSVDYRVLPSEQLKCDQVKALASDPKFKVGEVGPQGVLCDFSLGYPRVLVPAHLRRQVFDSVHGLAHPSGRTTKALLSRRFLWPSMAADALSWSRECLSCQRSKVTLHNKAPVQQIPVPARRFSHLHVDLVGPLPVSGGCEYLFTVVDRSTRWPEAIPLASTTASSCADALLTHWVSRFGVPAHLTSDRGPQFVSALWQRLCAVLGITHHQTTAYHPESNGMVERFHRSMKNSLRARCVDGSWFQQLPWVLLGLRTTPKEGIGLSAAEMVFGTTLCLPGEFLSVPEPPPSEFFSQLRHAFSSFAPPPPVHAAVPPSREDLRLRTCSHVFVRRDGHVPPLSPLYTGPFLVLHRSSKTFQLQVGTKSDNVSVDRLKPCLSSAPVVPQQPPTRGRPPKPVQPPVLAPRRPRGRPRLQPQPQPQLQVPVSAPRRRGRPRKP